jgi:hypothetical protein
VRPPLFPGNDHAQQLGISITALSPTSSTRRQCARRKLAAKACPTVESPSCERTRQLPSQCRPGPGSQCVTEDGTQTRESALPRSRSSSRAVTTPSDSASCRHSAVASPSPTHTYATPQSEATLCGRDCAYFKESTATIRTDRCKTDLGPATSDTTE